MIKLDIFVNISWQIYVARENLFPTETHSNRGQTSPMRLYTIITNHEFVLANERISSPSPQTLSVYTNGPLDSCRPPSQKIPCWEFLWTNLASSITDKWRLSYESVEMEVYFLNFYITSSLKDLRPILCIQTVHKYRILISHWRWFICLKNESGKEMLQAWMPFQSSCPMQQLII